MDKHNLGFIHPDFMSDLYLGWLQVNELSRSVEVLRQSSLSPFFLSIFI